MAAQTLRNDFWTQLRSLKIRLPNPRTVENQYVTLEEAISQGILQRLFIHQYHTDNNTVEFIPRYIRPIIDNPRFFYKSGCRPDERDPREKSTNPVLTAGFEHELLVQDKFEGLGRSELFGGSRITVFHNIKKDFLKFRKLKKFLNNEYDLVVCDVNHGVLVVETKRRENENFTGNSLQKELKKQHKRRQFLCAIKDFLGIEIPITPVILTSLSGGPDWSLTTYESKSYVLGVNFGADNFDQAWHDFLIQLEPPVTPLSRTDIDNFIATLDAILYCGDTPSQLHMNLTGGSVSQPGKYQLLYQNKQHIVIWTKQQRAVRDFLQDTLIQNARDELDSLQPDEPNSDKNGSIDKDDDHLVSNPKKKTLLKLLINGCFGSGKTLMLTEAAKFFCEVNQEMRERKVAYVVFDMKGDTFLLGEQLQASFEGQEVTKGRVKVYNIAGYSPTNSCCQYGYIQSLGKTKFDLLLLDEYFLCLGPGLICNLHDSPANMLITTRFKYEISLWETKLGTGFTQLELSGNIRSNAGICRYISAMEKTEVWAEQVYQDPVALTVDHNSRGRSNIEEIDLTLDLVGFYIPICSTIIDKISSIIKADKKERIYVIANTIKPTLHEMLKSELEKIDVPFGNVRYFFGCEASTVVYIGRKKDELFTRDDAVSRASVNLVVFNIVEDSENGHSGPLVFSC